jgi:hypothetical protein
MDPIALPASATATTSLSDAAIGESNVRALDLGLLLRTWTRAPAGQDR